VNCRIAGVEGVPDSTLPLAIASHATAIFPPRHRGRRDDFSDSAARGESAS
jgi:hypothetical protein